MQPKKIKVFNSDEEQKMYRAFFVDKLGSVGIIKIKKRIISNSKLGALKREYIKCFKSNPEVDFLKVKDSYLGKDPAKMARAISSDMRIKKYKPRTTKAIRDYRHKSWLALRKKVFARDNHQCLKCLSKKLLHCHHTYYLPGRSIWEYPLFAFETLCQTCHNEFHKHTAGSKLVIRTKAKIALKIIEENKQK